MGKKASFFFTLTGFLIFYLKFTLSDINITISVFLVFLFAYYTFAHPFILTIVVHWIMSSTKYREYSWVICCKPTWKSFIFNGKLGSYKCIAITGMFVFNSVIVSWYNVESIVLFSCVSSSTWLFFLLFY